MASSECATIWCRGALVTDHSVQLAMHRLPQTLLPYWVCQVYRLAYGNYDLGGILLTGSAQCACGGQLFDNACGELGPGTHDGSSERIGVSREEVGRHP